MVLVAPFHFAAMPVGIVCGWDLSAILLLPLLPHFARVPALIF